MKKTVISATNRLEADRIKKIQQISVEFQEKYQELVAEMKKISQEYIRALELNKMKKIREKISRI